MTMFPYFPDPGIEETWSWKTDILKAEDGSEQRLSLIDRARVKLSASVFVKDMDTRMEMNERLKTIIKDPFYCPLWQYAAPITQTTVQGQPRIYFDPAGFVTSVGARVTLIDPRSGVLLAFEVDTIHSNGVTLTAGVSRDIEPGWVVCPALYAMVTNSAYGWDTVSGDFNFQAMSMEEETFQRSGSTASLTTFNGTPVLEKLALEGANESYTFEYTMLDSGLGARKAVSRQNLIRVNRSLSFKVSRVLDPEEMDYWRLFLDTIKGSWKAFFHSTNLPDYELGTIVSSGLSTIPLQLANQNSEAVWRDIEIVYANGTKTYHRITSFDTDLGTATISPAMPADSRAFTVQRVSALLKLRAADSVVLRHGSLDTVIAFDVFATNEG